MTEDAPREIGIKGAYLQPLKIIEAPGGAVLRMLRSDSPLLPCFPNGFGEIYFSEILPGEIKAWKMHKIQNQLFAVPTGQIKIVLYDARADSNTLQVMCEMILGRPDNYNLLRIPAGVWYGFEGVGKSPSLICNCADIDHDPNECLRLPRDTPDIPYSWAESR